MSGPATLDPQQRSQARRRLRSERFDVLVVGGGVTGAGVALDAAARGLRVALVEKRDVASGTSSRSSKLIHGGLRYLEQRDLGLVREALRERTLLLETVCPHLVRPVPFMYPLRHHGWERAYAGAGVWLYDLFAGPNPLPRHRHLSRRQALRAAPALRDDAIAGAIRYWDAQVDDARHTVELARTAARHGATVMTDAEVTDLLRDGDAVVGAVVTDHERGEAMSVRADQTITAAGVWSEDVQRLAGQPAVSVNASKGIHLVVPRDRLDAETALILRTERSVLLVIPWPAPPHHRHWLIGTTDTGWPLDKDHPTASRADIDYLLARLNEVVRHPLGRADIEAVYAGLRPLAHSGDGDTATASREHTVTRPVPGLVTVTGGKYTTYRVMAADAVDAAAEGLSSPVPPSSTARLPLLGARGFAAVWSARARLARDTGLPLSLLEHLLRRYGALTTELCEALADRPELGQPIPGAQQYLRVEAWYAAAHEGARDLDDVLSRRTRIAMETADRGETAAEAVAPLIAAVLGWTDDETAAAIARYRAWVRAQRTAEAQPDDSSAAAALATLRSSPLPTPPAPRSR